MLYHLLGRGRLDKKPRFWGNTKKAKNMQLNQQLRNNEAINLVNQSTLEGVLHKRTALNEIIREKRTFISESIDSEIHLTKHSPHLVNTIARLVDRTEAAEELLYILEDLKEECEVLAFPSRSWNHREIAANPSGWTEDVLSRFPEVFSLRAFARSDRFRVSACHSYLNYGEHEGDYVPVELMIYTDIQKDDGTWTAFAKGTLSELVPEIIKIKR